jgi:hypothetical protein
MKSYYVILVVVLGMVTVPAATSASPATSTPVAADQPTAFAQTNETAPDSASAYLTAFRDLNGTAAYTSYSEFEIIRSQAVFAVQIGNFTETKAERMALVLDLLQTFDSAYSHQQAGEYGDAIDAANETNAVSSQLRTVEGGEQYAVLSAVALERFYDRTGRSLQSTAESESVTPDRITTLRRAALAYQRAGATDRYSQVLLRVDSTEQTYQTDVSEMNTSAASASAFVDSCTDCDSVTGALTTYGFSVFPKYREAQSAAAKAETAISLAEKHGLSSRASALTTVQSNLGSVQTTLALASAALIVGYTTVLGLVCSLIAWRLTVWKRDLEAAAHGDSVLVGAMIRG